MATTVLHKSYLTSRDTYLRKQMKIGYLWPGWRGGTPNGEEAEDLRGEGNKSMEGWSDLSYLNVRSNEFVTL